MHGAERNPTLPDIDPTSDRPVYKQIADALRDQIEREALEPGDRLPSEATLTRQFDTARGTVRRALALLSAEGRVRTERGVGVFVKNVVEADAVVRQPYDRLKRHYRRQGKSPLLVDADSRGLPVRQDMVELAEVPAPPRVAERLGVDTETTVFVRRRRMWMGRTPTQLTAAYLPLDLAVGALRAEDVGEGGTHARIEEMGHRLTHVVEQLGVRMPTPREKRQLRLQAGVPVVDLTQTAYTADRALECFTAVIAGDRYRFEYRIPAE